MSCMSCLLPSSCRGEVSLNWVGSLLTAPLEVRREELRLQYGFTCGCQRCTAEARHAGTPLAELLSATYATCQRLSPQLDGAIQAGDVRAVGARRERLVAMQAEVEAALRVAQPRVNAKTKRWLQASVYDMYDLISLCGDELAAAAALAALVGDEGAPDGESSPSSGAGGGGKRGGMNRRAAAAAATAPVVETESLAVACRVVEGVSPGSDAHAHLSAELVMRCLERFGPAHEEYRQARAGVVRAYGIRYGSVGPEVMEQLVAARLAAEAEGEEDGEEEGEEEEGVEGV
ncbi:hypothetical protein TSOC_003727 [Tetrabaena socialis]|uniref:SET domain-containing protein n=1 Tax=Tetrabaena socialis TaxID=47790 RepID=A0A2J8AAZ7_9CHLO|nr:hypothetical protein TSOC_003727 [Tetrabaena socialis]|eukprot:PNH09643.1 hypothetical protein TSOC_003727 [Tetrabaena socialis]